MASALNPSRLSAQGVGARLLTPEATSAAPVAGPLHPASLVESGAALRAHSSRPTAKCSSKKMTPSTLPQVAREFQTREQVRETENQPA